jgi:GNAT superfamily N-acetyltransferase
MPGEVVVRELFRLDEMVVVYPLIAQLNPELDEATFRRRLGEMLEERGYRLIAAYLEDRLVGVAGFWIGTQLWCGRYVEPDNVVVDSSLRGGGIGRRLMEWIEAEGERIGCEVMKLEAYAARTRTRQFYRRIGFAEPGVVMLKPLAAAGDGAMEAIEAKNADLR